MLPRNQPDRIRIVFDDHRLVANAGLLLPATLVRHLGLRELVDHHLDLGGAPGRANTGDKLMTLVASAMAGGDCIDDADVLRTGGTACTLGGTVKAPSTLGTFLRSFRWGHVRQLDRVSRELLARAWALPDGGGGNRPPSGQPNVPANSRQSGLRVPLASSPRYLALTTIRRRSQSLPAATEDRHRPPLPHSHPFGGFGLRWIGVRQTDYS